MAINGNTARLTRNLNQYNAVMNGDMNIWQRGTSFSGITIPSGAFYADRWRGGGNTTAAVHTISRSTDVPTVAQAGRLFNYSMLVDCTTLDSSIAVGDLVTIVQPIEGFNFLPLAQKTFTLSFWVKATKTGIYCVSFRNSGTDRSYVAEYTVNATATWEYKTITVPPSPSGGTWDYTNGAGLFLGFTLAAGTTYHTTANAWNTGNFAATVNQVNATDSASNDWRITGVKMEEGSVATPTRPGTYDDQLFACQRYYQSITDFIPFQNNATAGNLVLACWVFPQPMRISPAITYITWTYNNASGVATNLVNTTLVRVSVTTTATSSGVTYGSGQITASAEL